MVSLLATALAGLYVLGALAYWKKLEYHENFLTAAKQLQENNRDVYVAMYPWQKTLMCALWFIVVPLEELSFLRTTIDD